MKTKTPVLLWLRKDLRLADHPALRAAADSGRPVIPVYIHSPEEEGAWAPGGASRWWLHHSLTAFHGALQKKNSRLIVRRGKALPVLRALCKESGAGAVYWTRRYEPQIMERDQIVKETLRGDKIEAESFNGSLLFEPWTVKNLQGSPYKVYTAFWNKVLTLELPRDLLPAPATIAAPAQWPESLPLAQLRLLPEIPWDKGFYNSWQPGEKGAQKALRGFSESAVLAYGMERDRPDHCGTSRLSPHLHFGEISSLQAWKAFPKNTKTQGYLRQIMWREFAYYLLYHFPETPLSPLRAEFSRFHWEKNPALLRAWQKGKTGYPIVDAGMRELWQTGWMHNRVRMIAASFLVKDLLLAWQEGAAWFWDTLADADLANNTMGWQWVAGCGADAAPFFRIFNPVLQGKKFDPDGNYVRRWVPELAALPAAWIHEPWQAPREILRTAGVSLGKNYPLPVIDHAQARMRALLRLDKIKQPS